MHTDKVPKKASRKEEYDRSDAMCVMDLPPAEPSRSQALKIKAALAAEKQKELQTACKALLETLAAAYNVSAPKIKILATRPRQVTESWVYETFGDYDPETTQIRLWMRTAIQKKATSYGTFLATLCHEFCHHLDMVSLDFPETFHTRGFYERTAFLYHHIQNTPVRRIVWRQQKDGTYGVDWSATMKAPAVVQSSQSDKSQNSKTKSKQNPAPSPAQIPSSRAHIPSPPAQSQAPPITQPVQLKFF